MFGASGMAITKELEIETKATLEEIQTALSNCRIKSKIKNGGLQGKQKGGLFSKTSVTASVMDDGELRVGSVIIVGPAQMVSTQMAQLKLSLKAFLKNK